MTQTVEAPPDLCAVSRERHGRKFWRHPWRLGFARSRRSVPLILAEIAPAAVCFPVVFVDGPDGPLPHALLRTSLTGQTPFVGPDGRWHAAWLPPALAMHPFALVPDDGGALALAVDETTGLIDDDPRGTAFFTAEGAMSPALEAVAAELRTRASAGAATLHAGRALRECGVLVPLAEAAGFLRVDPARAEGLGEDGILDLHRAGALGLLHAALISAAHFDWLKRAEALAPLHRATPEAQPAAPRARDFLDALGRARDRQGYMG